MKLVFVLAVALVVGTAVLIGYAIWWETNDPGRGTITDKNHRAAYITCSKTGTVTNCTNHPECWRISYTDGRHDGDACVTQREYETYEVGGYYPAGAR